MFSHETVQVVCVFPFSFLYGSISASSSPSAWADLDGRNQGGRKGGRGNMIIIKWGKRLFYKLGNFQRH